MTTTRTRPWTSVEVCELAKVSYKQLHHWVAHGWLCPNNARDGSGHPRIWPEAEVVKAVALSRMVRAGISHTVAAALIADGYYATLELWPLAEELQL